MKPIYKTTMLSPLLSLTLTLALDCVLTLRAAEPVAVTVTDRVLVPDTERIGINLCHDNYWDSVILKQRFAENFEGMRYRMTTWGPEMDEQGIYVYYRPDGGPETWAAMKGVVHYVILGGPDKGKSGLVKDIREQVSPTDPKKEKHCYIEFDQKVQPLKQNQIGVMLELDQPDQGSIRDSTNPAVWNSLGNTASIGDVPPGSFGKAALWLKGTEKPAHYHYGLAFKQSLPESGSAWRVSLWTKIKSGSPKLVLQMDKTNTDIPVGNEWCKQELKIELPGKIDVSARLIASGGDVLVDDVEFTLDEPGNNPTSFRDIVVDPLKKLHPGILRLLQMGGSDMETNLRPALQQLGWTRDFSNLLKGGRNNPSRYAFNLHEFYVLCEYIGACPWYCVPGTIHPDEMTMLMEYLGAPADVGYGKLRAEQGHPKPWTEVFRNIYVEYGNEAWNPAGYATGSYNGPDHWKDLTAAAKASPYYRKNVLLVGGAQAGSPGVAKGVINCAPNLDRVAVAPYMIHNLTASDVAPLDTDDKLFKWIFGFADWRVNEKKGEMRQNFEIVNGKNIGLAIYEHNFHITKPLVSEGGAPVALRNKIIASLGGGLDLVNDSLHMMRDLRLRDQCLFNLNQTHFSEDVRLWGFMPGLHLKDQHYRPSFLATEMANHAIMGDMVETSHPADEPTFIAHGIISREWGKKPEFTDYGPLPTLRSYAFKEGNVRSLILFNFDTKEAHAVKFSLPGTVKGKTARSWRLASDSIAANNEYETGEPQVNIAEETVENFSSGSEIKLPPHSMLVLKWETEK